MRIGIVNDRPLAVEALRRALATRPGYPVAWVAASGEAAVARCARDTPDLVLMDLLMPGMDGVEATRLIMASTPCPILVVTVSVGANAGHVFEAMGHGALDAVDTPRLGLGDPRLGAAPLLDKIEAIGRLINEPGRSTRVPPEAVSAAAPAGGERLIAIGASAGGPAALATVLGALPKDLAAPVVIVQHVDEQFAPSMVAWLNGHSALPVRLAAEGDRLVPGTVYVAGTSDHLTLKSRSRVGYTPEPIEYAYRPSVDVFFRSVSRVWRGHAIGVLLTGMGRDGAKGLKELRDKGHHTIAQDQATSAVYGMPKAAASLDAAVDILPLREIAPRLLRLARQVDRKPDGHSER